LHHPGRDAVDGGRIHGPKSALNKAPANGHFTRQQAYARGFANRSTAMRIAALLSLALVATPALAFDAQQVLQPAALAGVQQVYVAPAVLALPEPAGRFERRRGYGVRPVTANDAQVKADDLTAALRRGFDRDFTVVDAPGPGVLVVEPTLTRLEATRPTMADYHEEPGLSFESVYAGGAGFSVRLARDGRDVALIQDRYVGSFSDGSPRIGIWQDTDRAFSMWARQLPAFVEQPATAAR
jgi:hypothetical protein